MGLLSQKYYDPTITVSAPVAILAKHGGPNESPIVANGLPSTKTLLVVAITTLGCPLPKVSSIVSKEHEHWEGIGVVHPAFGVGK